MGRSTLAAVMGGKTAGAASRLLGRGGGTALPGLVAERIDPDIVADLAAQLRRGAAIVTGTNGKTTTSRMLAGILTAAGQPVIHNRSGSNLMRGLAATLTGAAGITGRLPDDAVGVFEVDEATLPAAAAAIRPRVIVFTNLFRDQLDRYGEVDAISGLWRTTLTTERLPGSEPPIIILNADDPSVAALRAHTQARVLTFGVEDVTAAAAETHAADARWCARCGTEFAYTTRFFWHVGHWQCPGCGDARPRPDVAARAITLSADDLHLTMDTPAGALNVRVPLTGLYNAYNALAATAAALAMGASPTAITTALAAFTPAFGRQEALMVRGRSVQVMLCKNPAGVNQVIRALIATAGDTPLRLLMLLNDDTADGRDISWIWDVDFELLADRTDLALASGTRAADLALRLDYAGLGDHLALERDIPTAIGRGLALTPPGGRLYVLPTYTAMLTARDHVATLAGRGRFWLQ